MINIKEKLIELLNDHTCLGEDVCENECSICLAEHLISNNVTIQKYGKWEQIQLWATKAKYRCSACGREIMSATKVNMEKYPYCHCGAKMSD